MKKYHIKEVGETHSEAVEEVIARLLVLQEQLKILKNLKRYTSKISKGIYKCKVQKLNLSEGLNLVSLQQYE